MGKVTKVNPVKLIIGLIFKENSILEQTKKLLIKSFGTIDYESQEIPFNFTDYYEVEIGKNLKKKFLSFSSLIRPEQLREIKLATNRMELKLAANGSRRINIDPGYLDLARYILATTKDYAHRICLGKGIFAELTLNFKNGTFAPLEWTYPDYKTENYIKTLNDIRQIFAGQQK